MDTNNNTGQQKTDEQLLDKLILTLTQMQKDVQDPAEIEHVLDKSKLDAEQGDPKAQYHLGLYHETEKQEEAEALRLFHLAAAQQKTIAEISPLLKIELENLKRCTHC